MIRHVWLLLFVACAPQIDSVDMASYLNPGPLKFLVAGQSNGVSRGQYGLVWYYSHTSLVTLNDYYSRGVRIPTASNPMNGGLAWIMLGDLIAKPIEFNIIAVGGTSTQQWRDTYFNKIKVALSSSNYSAILWVQGESDWGLQFTSEQTYQNMKWLITEANKVRNVPWYVCLDGFGGAPRAAQIRIIAEGLAFAGPDVDDMRKTSKWFEASGAEIIEDGLHEFARRWKNLLGL